MSSKAEKKLERQDNPEGPIVLTDHVISQAVSNEF